jgi:hypothetical protein
MVGLAASEVRQREVEGWVNIQLNFPTEYSDDVRGADWFVQPYMASR